MARLVRFRSSLGGVIGVLMALMLAGGVSERSGAQEGPFVKVRPVSYDVPHSTVSDCGLRKEEIEASVVHRLDSETPRSKAASIQVEYAPNVPSAARSAFERAVSIWETHIESDVEIRIQAGAIDDPPEGALGGARPTQFWVLENESGPQFIAGDALTDALTGQDVAPDSSDMRTNFNFERDDWHFGEGPAPAGTIDFTSVVLHEIAHGLHYLSLCRKTAGGGQCRFGVGAGASVPGLFSAQLREQLPDGRLRALTDESVYPTSESVGLALTSDRLFFAGEQTGNAAQRSTGPVPPKIFAPPTFRRGSSLSHLDESIYPIEGTNALMTPFIATAETNRQPGPVVCGQLADIGWSLGVSCEQHFQDVFNVRFAAQTDSSPERVTLTWEQRDGANIDEFIVERRYFDEGFEVVKRGVDAPPVTLDSLGLGRFSFRVRWVRSDGTQGVSVRNLKQTVPLQTLAAEVGERDQQGRGAVEVGWDVPPGTSPSFTFRVERAEGDGGRFREVDVVPQNEFAAQRQPPGNYSYRVVARDQQGNELVSDAVPVRIPFDGPVYVDGPYPNPTRDRATLILTARRFQDTTVEVFNSIGQRMYRRKRILGRQEPMRFSFDSRDWASGLYVIRVQGQTFTTTRKMMVVR